ncbi:MAG: glutaminyl-peptide cyclotransferase [Thermoanaerobaculia bacterium]
MIGWLLLLSLGGCSEAPATPGVETVAAEQGAGNPAPAVQRLTVKILRTLPHDPNAFTQGLLWHKGTLYESTGRYGVSSLRRVSTRTGEVEQQVALPPELFGEGLALVGDELIQLTWLEGVARRYRLADLALVGQWSYGGEGWGLCWDGRRLVMTDGGDELQIRDADEFTVVDRRRVTLLGRPLDRLNELECAEGWVYANRLGSTTIYRIDPQSGEVTATIDASALSPAEPQPEQVLNGIAYDPRTQHFYLTGKLWSNLYEVVFVP